MKNLLIIVCLGLILSLHHISCTKKDPCEGVTCQNNGTCESGNCKCPLGYEGQFCQSESLPKTINVTSIKVIRLPATKSDGSKWDTDNTAPDIFPVIYTMKSDNKTVDVPFWTSDLIKLNAPVDQQHEFTVITPKLSFTSIDKNLAIFLFDKDDANQESMASGILFNLKDYIKGRPASILLDCATCKIAFEIRVSYVL